MHKVGTAAANKGLDVNRIEGSIPKEFGSDAVAVPGARDLLASFKEAGASWAIVTSGTQSLLNGVRHTFHRCALLSPMSWTRI